MAGCCSVSHCVQSEDWAVGGHLEGGRAPVPHLERTLRSSPAGARSGP